jgi:two-component system, response regulator YesN
MRKGGAPLLRVLVVDNSQIIRTSVAKSIEEYGLPFVVSGMASNGVRALEWLDAHYADLCVTDVQMPVMNGLELIGHIKERFPWMACIVISSYDDFRYVKQSLELEALEYILKPFGQDTMEKTLSKTSNKINSSRNREAAEILLKHLSSNRDMLERWIYRARTGQSEKLPLLVVDTLECLEKWVQGRYYMLPHLAMAWLSLVSDELKKENLLVEMFEGEDTVLGNQTLTSESIRFHFRLCMVRRLEEGAIQIFMAADENKVRGTSKIVRQIQQYIRDHYAEKINLQEIADSIKISKGHLSNLFKQETDVTIWNYVVSIRMEKAGELLLQPSMRTYEVALMVGYEDQTHFSQLFKEHYGLTPSEYKKRLERSQ